MQPLFYYIMKEIFVRCPYCSGTDLRLTQDFHTSKEHPELIFRHIECENCGLDWYAKYKSAGHVLELERVYGELGV